MQHVRNIPEYCRELSERAKNIACWFGHSVDIVKTNRSKFAGIDISVMELFQKMLAERVVPHASHELHLPLVVAVCGGTNSGKSTVFNSICRTIASPSGGTASVTKRIIGAGNSEQFLLLEQSHESYEFLFAADVARGCFENCVHKVIISDWEENLPLLLDTPDIDSSDPLCRATAISSLFLADVIVWLTTQQKYKDESGVTFLDKAMMLHKIRIDAFNQALPRHDEAIEDMVSFYGERWPDNERIIMRIDEQRELNENILPKSSVKPLKDRLAEMHNRSESIKAFSILHGIEQTGFAALNAVNKLITRIREWNSLHGRISKRLTRDLYEPLNSLSGHEAPFELQSAILKILGPRIQTPVGELLKGLHRSIDRVVSFALKLITLDTYSGKSDSCVDPVLKRDEDDMKSAVSLIEKTGSNLSSYIKRGIIRRQGIYREFYEQFKGIKRPEGENLSELVRDIYANRKEESLDPIVANFESELEKFCNSNPSIMLAMRTVIPGVAVLGAVVAAMIPIELLAALPGSIELLFGGIAIPVYKMLEKNLPGNILSLADTLSRQPFISKAREDFRNARIKIFAEMGDCLAKAVLTAAKPPELDETGIHESVGRLKEEWISAFCRNKGEQAQ